MGWTTTTWRGKEGGGSICTSPQVQYQSEEKELLFLPQRSLQQLGGSAQPPPQDLFFQNAPVRRAQIVHQEENLLCGGGAQGMYCRPRRKPVRKSQCRKAPPRGPATIHRPESLLLLRGGQGSDRKPIRSEEKTTFEEKRFSIPDRRTLKSFRGTADIAAAKRKRGPVPPRGGFIPGALRTYLTKSNKGIIIRSQWRVSRSLRGSLSRSSPLLWKKRKVGF